MRAADVHALVRHAGAQTRAELVRGSGQRCVEGERCLDYRIIRVSESKCYDQQRIGRVDLSAGTKDRMDNFAVVSARCHSVKNRESGKKR